MKIKIQIKERGDISTGDRGRLLAGYLLASGLLLDGQGGDVLGIQREAALLGLLGDLLFTSAERMPSELQVPARDLVEVPLEEDSLLLGHFRGPLGFGQTYDGHLGHVYLGNRLQPVAVASHGGVIVAADHAASSYDVVLVDLVWEDKQMIVPLVNGHLLVAEHYELVGGDEGKVILEGDHEEDFLGGQGRGRGGGGRGGGWRVGSQSRGCD